LTLQVLDGILCHDGEIHAQALYRQPEKSFQTLDKEIANKTADPDLPVTPMTVEGCVVRMADTISYIGRDVEDAIRLDLIRRDELPRESVERLGDTNGTIVYNLVTDVIQHSFGKPAIAFSEEASEALKKLREFNLNRIYLNQEIKPSAGEINRLFKLLFERYVQDVQQGNEASIIFTEYLADMSDEYKNNTGPAEIARDFIAGMTDEYFLRQCPDELQPQRITGRL